MTDIQHAMNVSELSRKIGEKMKLGERACALLAISGMFHDIGKMGIRFALLDKPDTLTPDEYKIIQWHTTVGHLMLSSMPDDVHKEAAEIALYHHERLDGSGYMGLAGNQIPVMARIVAVADVYDALTTNRPYRKAWTQSEAKLYLCGTIGKLFDGSVVTALVGE